MSALHEGFTGSFFESRWQPCEQAELHRGENKQSHRAEEQRGEADKMKQIVIELTNVPVLALVMSDSQGAEKPDPPTNSDTTGSFWDIVEIILKMIVDGAKAIFSQRNEEK